jgi:hypothetical protein
MEIPQQVVGDFIVRRVRCLAMDVAKPCGLAFFTLAKVQVFQVLGQFALVMIPNQMMRDRIICSIANGRGRGRGRGRRSALHSVVIFIYFYIEISEFNNSIFLCKNK